MDKFLSPWCRSVKIELLRKGMSVSDLAQAIGKSRVYTSSIVHGRVRAETTERAISDVLNIPYDYDAEPRS